jgi:8-oxo-dGTP pyrophosphatase MutT (NUDIX family)
MIEATSAGAILFRDTRGRREYLLLKSRPGDWEFPKGGIEGEEELQQTAIREVTEEAGIEDFRLLDGFRQDYDYVFEANGNTIHKTVHLFVAKSFEASAELSKEHRDMQWRDYEQAINTITQDGPREILRDAHDFLDEYFEEGDEETPATADDVDAEDSIDGPATADDEQPNEPDSQTSDEIESVGQRVGESDDE